MNVISLSGASGIGENVVTLGLGPATGIVPPPPPPPRPILPKINPTPSRNDQDGGAIVFVTEWDRRPLWREEWRERARMIRQLREQQQAQVVAVVEPLETVDSGELPISAKGRVRAAVDGLVEFFVDDQSGPSVAVIQDDATRHVYLGVRKILLGPISGDRVTAGETIGRAISAKVAYRVERRSSYPRPPEDAEALAVDATLADLAHHAPERAAEPSKVIRQPVVGAESDRADGHGLHEAGETPSPQRHGGPAAPAFEIEPPVVPRFDWGQGLPGSYPRAAEPPPAGVAAPPVTPPASPGPSQASSWAKAAIIVAAGVAGGVLISNGGPSKKPRPSRPASPEPSPSATRRRRPRGLGIKWPKLTPWRPQDSYPRPPEAPPARPRAEAAPLVPESQPKRPRVRPPMISEVVDYPAHASIQEKWIKCGKVECGTCPHGPYLYAMWWNEEGKVITKYLGKKT